MNWSDRQEVQKGAVGEAILDDWLRAKGFVPYFPAAGGPHPFDRLCASRDKRTIFVADAKAKAARTFYPDSGINVLNYDDYSHIQSRYSIHVFLFFIDERKGEIYGNFLRTLDQVRCIRHRGKERTYPRVEGGIRFWPLIAMRHIAKLSAADISDLKEHSTRHPKYDKAVHQ